jgi:hypothetical protein
MLSMKKRDSFRWKKGISKFKMKLEKSLKFNVNSFDVSPCTSETLH